MVLEGFLRDVREEFRVDDEMVTLEYTLDNIISIRVPRGADHDTIHATLHEQLKTIVFEGDDQYQFHGEYKEADQ